MRPLQPTEVSSPAVPRDPVVSVLMVTYNHERFVGQAVESVMAQDTSFPFELIIGEDCSTDGTRAIVLDWQRRYPDRIRVLLQPRNVGGTRNMFAVEGAARGEFVAEIEGDDYWIDRSKLQRQVEALRACPEAVLCGARAYVWHDGADQPTEVQPPDPSDVLARYGARELLEGRWWFRTCTKMYRRSALAGLPPNLGGDWVSTLWVLSRSGFAPVCFVDAVVGVYRIYGGGSWSSLTEVQRYASDVFDLSALLSWFEGDGRDYLLREMDDRLEYLAKHEMPGPLRRRVASTALRSRPFSRDRWRRVLSLWLQPRSSSSS